MEFEYSCGNVEPCTAFPAGPRTCRPIIAVRIQRNGIWTDPIPAVVDTGSDYCVFYGRLAKDLGLVLEDLPSAPAQGIGKADLRIAPVILDTGCFGQWEIRAAFAENDIDFALLGYIGFLEKFAFSTNPKEATFTLEKVDA